MSLNKWILGKNEEEIVFKRIKNEVKKAFLTKKGTEFKFEKKHMIEDLVGIIAKKLNTKEDIVRKHVEKLLIECFIFKDYMNYIYYYPKKTAELKHIMDNGIKIDHDIVINGIHDKIHKERLLRKQEKKKELREEIKAIKETFERIQKEVDDHAMKEWEEETKEMTNEEKLKHLEKKMGKEKFQEEIQLGEEYELETGKSVMTLKKTVRKDFIKWKALKIHYEKIHSVPSIEIIREKAKKIVNKEEKQQITEEEKVEKVLGELDNKKLDAINLQDAIEEKELREQYKLETSKNAITLAGTVRKSYLKWKIEQ